MELFAENIDTLEKDINDLRNKLLRCKSITETRSIVLQLDSLISLYTELTGSPNYLRKFRKNKHAHRFINGYINKMEDKYINNFCRYKEIHKSISSNIIKRYPEFENKLNDFYPNIEEIKYSELVNVMSDFLKSYGKGYEKILTNLIKEKRIYILDNMQEDAGTVYISRSIDNKMIVTISNKVKNTIQLMETIIHEIGHIIDYHQSSVSLKEDNEYYSNTFYGEVFSRFFEKEFAEYLIKNYVEVSGLAKYELEAMYYSLVIDVEGVAITSSLDNEKIKTEEYRYLDYNYIKELVKEKELSIDMDTYEKDLPPLEEFNLFEANLYGYGTIIASYLSHLRKSDINKFERVYSNFVRISRHSFSEELFQVLETTPNKLIDILFEEMNILSKNEKILKKM